MHDRQVSVIMCTYNGAEFLEEQVRSILSQTHTDFELIICDDNSSDTTPEILQGFAKNDTRISVHINPENIGYNKNFENAIRRAQHKYICISDQDDIWLPHKVERLLDLISAENALLSYHNTFNFTVQPPFEKAVNKKINVFYGHDVSYNIFHNSVSGHTMLFDKAVIESSAPFPENVYYDWWLTNLAMVKGKVTGTQEVLSYHRVHERNASQKTGHGKFLSAQECRQKIDAYTSFLSISKIGPENIHTLKKLIGYYAGLLNRTFSFSLFMYLVMHSSRFLFFRRSGFLNWSRIKTCYRLSRLFKTNQ